MEDLFTLWRDAVRVRPIGMVLAFATASRQFKKFIKDRPVAEVAKKLVIAFRDKLLKENGKAIKTVETKLNLLSAMFQVAVDAEQLSLNPVLRIRVPKPNVPPVARVPYSVTDLQVIFSGPVYAGGKIIKGGAGDAAKWLPPLGLLSEGLSDERAEIATAIAEGERDLRESDWHDTPRVP